MTRHLATLRAPAHPESSPGEDYIFTKFWLKLDHCGLVVEPKPWSVLAANQVEGPTVFTHFTASQTVPGLLHLYDPLNKRSSHSYSRRLPALG